jgi:hypothetical protein
MTAAEPIECTDCHRPVVKSEPLWMFGNPYGPKCGARYGLRRERRRVVRTPRRTEGEHQPVLAGLEDEEINEESEEL